jgi:hypothetical protein
LLSEFVQNEIDAKDNSEISVSDCMFESIKNAVFTFVNFSLISDCSYEKFITA